MSILGGEPRLIAEDAGDASTLLTRTDRRRETGPARFPWKPKDRQQQHLSKWPAMRSVAVLRYGSRHGPHPRRFYTRPVRIAGHATDGRDELRGMFAPQGRLAVPLSTQAKATCESFLRTLKREQINATAYPDFESLHEELTEFIDRYYNRLRLHSALGYQSPKGFENQGRKVLGSLRLCLAGLKIR